ncbi:MAG: flagellar basal body L-ring protein FlgH [Alphaproteobacteria bacterium]|nr:flagellar basal body L-ring protein FlgH [Alphaproteobacteria bacterium]
MCMLMVAATGGCSTRLDHLGKAPTMTPSGAPREAMPREQVAYAAMNAAPTYEDEVSGVGSLWRSGPKSLFGDRRARTIGDILTVLIEINDEAEIRNRTNRTRAGGENLNIPALFGLPGLAADALPGGGTLAPAMDIQSTSNSTGDGLIQREERITLRVAATVARVLPNGHLLIVGDQEIRVNNELRDLQVTGVIRPEDISRQNVITYDKIAGARIEYGGRGQLMDLQQPRLGQQVVDIVSPF